MNKYLTLSELYESRDIDEEFVRNYEKLYPAAKARVLEKNLHLRMYLSRPRETIYDSIDFSSGRIDVDCVLLRRIPNDVKCREGHELEKTSVIVHVNGKHKGIYLTTCPVCKRIYSDLKDDIEKLERMNIPYYIVEGD